ncbi:hypothetical protein ACJMK2_010559 [Sinanodonta woodiana]
MALAYQLEKEFLGTDHIKLAPDSKVEWTATKRMLEKPTDIAGFYLAPKKSTSITVSESTDAHVSEPKTSQDYCRAEEETLKIQCIDSSSQNKSAENQSVPDINIDKNTEKSDTVEKEDSAEDNLVKADVLHIDIAENSDDVIKEDNIKSDNRKNIDNEGEIIPDNHLEEGSTDEEEDDDESDEDEDGWITPSNIKAMKEKMAAESTEQAKVVVGCLTTDFSMQNVLIQMGLNVISVDGMIIKRAKNFVLRCFACMKICKDLTKEFCPHCGNKSLQRVSMTVEEDGTIRYFLSRRKPVTAKGLKYSLPMPRGGKHAENPRLCEDQPAAQQRISKKARQQKDIFKSDYIPGQSPFSVNDVTSRAAQLGIQSHEGRNAYWMKRNPNEVKKNYGRRK